MNRIWGYGRTLFAYLHTEKGRHDFWDAMKAVAAIAATSAAAWLLLRAGME